MCGAGLAALISLAAACTRPAAEEPRPNHNQEWKPYYDKQHWSELPTSEIPGATRVAVSCPRQAGAAAGFVPRVAAAEAYGGEETRDATTPALDQALAECVFAVARDAGRGVPRLDPALSAMAAELARLASQHHRASTLGVEQLTRHVGLIGPTPYVLTLRGLAVEQDLTAQLRGELGPLLDTVELDQIGVGVSVPDKGLAGYVVVLFQARPIDLLEPLPRALPRAGSAVFRGRLKPGLQPPVEVAVRNDAGDEWTPAVEALADGDFSTRLSCGAAVGRRRVTVRARRNGKEVTVADFPLYCGVSAPRETTLSPEAERAPITSPEQGEAALMAAINRERERCGLARVAAQPVLSEVARTLSEGSTRSADLPSLLEYIRKANVSAVDVQEFSARAYSFEDIASKLAGDPEHRKSVLTESVQVGVGVGVRQVGRQMQFYVTELFAFPPVLTGVPETREYVLRLMGQQRSLVESPVLDAAAREVASKLVAGVPVEYAIDDITRQLRGQKTHFSRVTTLVRTVADATTFSFGSSLDDLAFSHFGLAVVEARAPGRVHVVVVLGVRKGRYVPKGKKKVDRTRMP